MNNFNSYIILFAEISFIFFKNKIIDFHVFGNVKMADKRFKNIEAIKF